MSILESHTRSAIAELQEVISLVKKQKSKVIEVTAIQENMCLESFPCRGHVGVQITLDNGNIVKHDCSSVSIGAVEYYYLPSKKNSHFSDYVNNNTSLKKEVDALRD